LLATPEVYKIWENKADQVLVYKRGNYLFIFNFNPTQSFADYGIPLEPSKYKVTLNTDSGVFGGFDRVDERITYYTIPTESTQHYLRLYIPSRSAFVLKQEGFKKVK
ncbi:MAG TPA: alpha amylase C-terminal domain-containing protein, partial [Prolixibacteraceae bacterium]|nr:alpha amylase C-terminal domain-containing protein [Prolixibacteraceae bacterium]